VETIDEPEVEVKYEIAAAVPRSELISTNSESLTEMHSVIREMANW
jgi:hypothetical protein